MAERWVYEVRVDGVLIGRFPERDMAERCERWLEEDCGIQPEAVRTQQVQIKEEVK